MKKNNKTLDLFMMRETLYCFLQKSTQPQASSEEVTASSSNPFLLESDISSHLMQQLINYNLVDSLNVDYTLLYQSFDVLDVLGFVTRKSDAKCNQRWLRWVGFGATNQGQKA
jgi:hypothetical protein